ncbi:hypothetical protein [Lactobacillus xujianguonis]|uniref:hypothetical protein n=1 Tax=Lactobacillus xujianguonis TaxID=2495899 RepID=UPI000FDB5DC8|nr:hypothetical protein [Lactobacillus xujianguonis]RVU72289.1 hypothetical protein EJK20_10725 [Lactobacillus xujianguonis]
MIIPPIVIYPIREKPTHLNITPSIIKGSNWNRGFIAGQTYFYKPALGLNQNPYLVSELRKLVIMYAKQVHSYFSTNFLTPTDQRKKVVYGNSDHLDYAYPNAIKKPRSFEELKDLTKELQPKEFAQQLALNEIPIAVLQNLLQRRNFGQFDLPVLIAPNYLDPRKDQYFIPNKNTNMPSFLIMPNHADIRLCDIIEIE